MQIELRLNFAGYLILKEMSPEYHILRDVVARAQKDRDGTSCLFLAEMSRNNIGTAPE